MAAEYEIVEGRHAGNAMLHDARARGGIDGVEEAAGRRHLKNAAATIVALAEALKKIGRGTSEVFDKNPQTMSFEEARSIARSALARLKGDSA